MSDTIISGAMMSTRSMSSEGSRSFERDTEKDMMGIGGNMNNDELDRILSKRDDIQPSSGFAVSVIDAVRSEASAPPPIPFPWKRALPVLLFAALALVAVVIVAVVAIVELGRGAGAPQLTSSLWEMIPTQARGPVGTVVAWTTAALLAAFVSVKLSMRLGAGRV